MPAYLFYPQGKLFGFEQGPDEQKEKEKNQSKEETPGIPGIKGNGKEQAEENARPSFFSSNHWPGQAIILLQTDIDQGH